MADKPSESAVLGATELGAADGFELVGGTAVIVCGEVLGTRRGGGGGAFVVELLVGGGTAGAGVVVVVFVTLGVKSVLPAINIYHKSIIDLAAYRIGTTTANGPPPSPSKLPTLNPIHLVKCGIQINASY